MKKIIIIIIFQITLVTFSQVDTSFYGLRGYEDLKGHTQLFYQMKSNYSINRGNDYYTGESRSDIFNYSLSNDVDSLFLLNGVYYYDPFQATGHSVNDFEFVDNTLTDFYQCGDGVTSFEPSPIVVYNREYDNSFEVQSFHGRTFNLEISKVDSNLNVYVSASDGIYTDSSGWSFDLIKSTEGFRLVSINKNKPNTMFAENNENYLFMSIDTGVTFFIVDNVNSLSSFYQEDFINRFFIYDSDNSHIYRIGINNNKYHLLVSENNGKLNSWERKFDSESELFISYDSTQSGLLYIATNKEIYESNNYGETFQLYKELDKSIKGIYKKPNLDLLYVTTSHSLLEISSDSIKVLKQLIDYDALSYYPLQIGDIWQYLVEGKNEQENKIDTSYTITEVTGIDTINGKEYYKIKYLPSNIIKQIRIDSMNTLVLEYNVEGDSNCAVNNFSLEEPNGNYYSCDFEHSFIRDTIETVFNEQKKIKIYESRLAVTCLCPYTISKYAQDIGKVYYDVVYPSMLAEEKHVTGTLVYGKINDKIYGDTTLVGVTNHVKNLPIDFLLSQNYPNPFNPTTTIKYVIPNLTHPLIPSREGKERSDRGVLLKVYDILGKEVTTLINKQQKSGRYEVNFNASKLSSGVYYYQLRSGDFIETKKMIILK